jgi:N-acetylglucosaminyl-diphospho-decaprenol L-rhamnosyltransferase
MVNEECAVIIVTYCSRREIDACIASVLAQTDSQGGLPPSILVVDNASSDDTVAHLRTRWPTVRVLAQTKNLGFAAANNVGIAATTARTLLLLNPDAVMHPGSLAALTSRLNQEPQAAIVGPRLLNPDGSLQSSCRDFPSLFGDLVGMAELARLPFLRRRLTPRMAAYDAHELARPVDWLSGACLLVRRRAIDVVGGMDEGYFMYGEELDWQHRMTQLGWTVWFEPSAVVTHVGGASTDRVPGRRIVWLYASIHRFYALHRSRWKRWMLRLIIWLVTLPKLLVLMTLLAFNPHHHRRRDYLVAYWEVLWL